MPPVSSRRPVLRGAALALLTATAGCSFGTEDSSGSGPGTSTTLPGSKGGRTFALVVNNDLSKDALSGEGLPKDTPAVVDVEVGRVVREKEDPLVFEDTVEARSGTSRTIEDAFDTDSGESYQVSGYRHPIRDMDETPNWLTERYQWEEGGFGAPEEPVVEVTVTNVNDGGFFLPGLAIDGQSSATE